MTPSRILLTGAAGFVGSYVWDALARRFPDARVVGLYAPLDGVERSGGVVADLLDRPALADIFERERPEIVIHLAAQSSVGLVQTIPAESTWTTNLTGSLNIALASAKHTPRATVLFASSAEVYGRSLAIGPVSEKSVLSPLNAYAQSKMLAERVLADVLALDATLIVARPFNHTGPGQREDFVLPSFAGQVARIEAGLQEPCMRVGNLDAARDFLDVRDVVDAYLALLAAAPKLPTRFVVNIASGQPRKLRDLLDLLRKMSRVPFDIEIDPSRLRPLDIPVAYANADLLRTTTGWAPKIDTEALLASLLDAARSSICRT